MQLFFGTSTILMLLQKYFGIIPMAEIRTAELAAYFFSCALLEWRILMLLSLPQRESLSIKEITFSVKSFCVSCLTQHRHF